MSVFVALMLALAACGSNDGEASDTTSTTDAGPTAEAPMDEGDEADTEAEEDEPESSDDNTEIGEGDDETASSGAIDDLCTLLAPAILTNAGIPSDGEASGDSALCEVPAGDYSVRVQDYTAVLPAVADLEGTEMVQALRTFMDSQGEAAEPLGGVGNGALVLENGTVYIVTGPQLLLLDHGFGGDSAPPLSDVAMAMASELR